MTPATIYGLCDPRTGMLRYVGKTTRPLAERVRKHLHRSTLTPRRHSSRWLAGLSLLGLAPEIFAIEAVPAGGDWVEAEQFWIAYFRAIGADLTNLANGGEGVAGYVWPEERKAQQREQFRGRVFTDDWRRRISDAKRGIPSAPRLPALRPPRTHCRNGHSWVPDNLVTRGGYAACRLCERTTALARYHRTKRLKHG